MLMQHGHRSREAPSFSYRLTHVGAAARVANGDDPRSRHAQNLEESLACTPPDGQKGSVRVALCLWSRTGCPRRCAFILCSLVISRVRFERLLMLAKLASTRSLTRPGGYSTAASTLILVAVKVRARVYTAESEGGPCGNNTERDPLT